MENLISNFNSINSHATLNEFVTKYSLQKHNSDSTFIMATYTGTLGENHVFVSHRWYDRCKTYVIQEDGNEISIEVKNPSGETLLRSSTKYMQD